MRLASPIAGVRREADGVLVAVDGGGEERFDEIVIAAHSDQALAMLTDPSPLEERILGAIAYRPNRVVLHRDPRLMPKRRGTWSAWNYLRSSGMDLETEVCVTYWMNALQGIDPAYPIFVSLNPAVEPAPGTIFGEWSFSHPQFDSRALSAQGRLDDIQGARRTWYAGAWTGHGFHEDGLRSGLAVAEALGGEVPWRKAVRSAADLPMAAE